MKIYQVKIENEFDVSLFLGHPVDG
jgi:hypothetical protein